MNGTIITFVQRYVWDIFIDCHFKFRELVPKQEKCTQCDHIHMLNSVNFLWCWYSKVTLKKKQQLQSIRLLCGKSRIVQTMTIKVLYRRIILLKGTTGESDF